MVEGSKQLVEVDCPICGCSQSKFLFTTRDYQLSISNDFFQVQRCTGCGCGFLSPRPQESDMHLYYPEEFYWALEGSDVEKTRESLLASRHQQLVAKQKILEGVSPGCLLDIGCQKGEFIYHMQEVGWSVEGVEFSETPDKMFDVPIRYGEFLDMSFDPESFQCVTMWAVLEHVYKPSEYVEKVASLLRPGGCFVGLVTNLNSIQGRCYQKDDYPRHLTIFTKRSLEHILESNGFTSIEIWTDQKIFGGSLRGGFVYLFKRLLGYNRDDIMKEWHSLEDDLLFAGKFRGRPSWIMRVISKVDAVVLGVLEKLLDKLGYGQLLLWKARKGVDCE